MPAGNERNKQEREHRQQGPGFVRIVRKINDDNILEEVMREWINKVLNDGVSRLSIDYRDEGARG